MDFFQFISSATNQISSASNEISSNFINQINNIPNVSIPPILSPNTSSKSNPATIPQLPDEKSLGYYLRPHIKEGIIIYEPSSPYQEYINKIEESIIVYLLELEDHHSTSLDGLIKSFEDECYAVGSHRIYPKTKAGAIRVLLRRIAQYQPLDLLKIICRLIGPSNIKAEKLQSLERHAKSLQVALSSISDVSFLPIDDEPYSNIAHLIKFMWKNVKLRSQPFRFRVIKSGSSRVQDGIYHPVLEEEDDPTYLNSQGYKILRKKRYLHPSYHSCDITSISSNHDNDNHTMISSMSYVYVWYIINSHLGHVYYYCATAEAWGVPPAIGWQCASYGQSPCPEVEYLDPRVETDVKAQDSTSQSTLRSFPIAIDAFSRVSNDKDSIIDVDISSTQSHPISNKLSSAPLFLSNRSRSINYSRNLIVWDVDGIDTESLSRHIIYTPFTSPSATNDHHPINPIITPATIVMDDTSRVHVDALHTKVQDTLDLSPIDAEIGRRCHDLKQVSEHQRKLMEKRMRWLDNADINDLVQGYVDVDNINMLDNMISDPMIVVEDKEHEDHMMNIFESRWKLDSILHKLVENHHHRDHNNNEDYIAIIAGIAEGMIVGYGSDGTSPRDHINTDPTSSMNDDNHVISPSSTQFDPLDDVHIDLTTLTKELFEPCISDRILRTPVAQVKMLGVELWPPMKDAAAKGIFEQIHYVIEIVISEVRTVPVTMENKDDELVVADTQDSHHNTSHMVDVSSASDVDVVGLDTITITNDNQNTMYNHHLKEVPVIIKSKSEFTPIREELVRRLHAKSAISRVRSFIIRHDLSSIFTFHTELEHILQGSDVILPQLPDPLTIAEAQDEVLHKMIHAEGSIESLNKKKIRYGQPYTYHSNSSFKLDSNAKADSSIQLKYSDKLDICMKQLQQYLTDLFALFDYFEDSMDDTSSTATTPPLIRDIGRLISQFLDCSELHDLFEFRRMFRMTPSIEVDHTNVTITSPAEILPMYQLSDYHALLIISPIWQPLNHAGICMRLLFHDVPGSNKKTDEELMRLQKSRCAGCGEPLVSNLFRFEKNYDACRFTGALYCRRWCHVGDRRILPHRLISDWDSKPHKVCRQAAYFLDHIYHQAIINVDIANPLLFDGVPALRQVKLFRRSIATLVDRALSKRNTFHAAAEAIVTILGPSRIHLCYCSNFYSIEDLVDVAKGGMIKKLYELYDRLREIVPRKQKSVGEVESGIRNSMIRKTSII